MEKILLEILKYEERLKEELTLTKNQAEEVVKEAQKAAKEMLELEWAKPTIPDDKYQKRLDKEILDARNKILQEKDERLKKIKGFDQKKIYELVAFAIRKIVGEE